MPHLRAIHRALAGAGPGWLEEALLEAARELVLIEEEIRRRVARVPAARVATRAETYRRLERGREFLHARVDAPMELAEMARAACLSRFHFHRAFRHAFGLTPHQYRTRLRLERAGALLSRGRPVTEVCLEVGFESLGSFSALFRRSFGVPPSEFARSKKRVAASADTLAANEC